MYDLEIAQLLHEVRLREAEKERLYKQVALNAPPLRKRLVLRFGDLLIAFGNRLKAYPAVQAGAGPCVDALKLKGAR